MALTTPSTDAGSGVAGYRHEYKRTADSTWTLDNDLLQPVHFPRAISGLTASTQYDFRLRARDFAGNIGSFSSTSQATTSASSSIWSWDIPTQADEQAFYDNVAGWTWTAGDKTTTFASTYSGPDDANYDVHNNTECDDLSEQLRQFNRTGTATYLTWATGWANDFYKPGHYLSHIVNTGSAEWVQGIPRPDHCYGWGLVEWARQFNDSAALTAAQGIAAFVQAQSTPTPGSTAMAAIGTRGRARHLIFLTYIAEYVGNVALVDFRNVLINAWVQSPDWVSGTVGQMVHYARFAIEDSGDLSSSLGGTAAYDAGRRAMGTFHIGILAEGLWRAYTATGRSDVRQKLIDLAYWVFFYAHDPTWVNPQAGAYFGQEGNLTRWHRGSDSGNVDIRDEDPVYDTSLVNVLVFGYKLTGWRPFFNRAVKHLRQGTRWNAGSSTAVVSQTEVLHYVSVLASSSDDGIVFDFNKGELQYCYQLFENGGEPTVAAGA